jgi:hypothetical protein
MIGHPDQCAITGEKVNPMKMRSVDVLPSGDTRTRFWIRRDLLDDDYRQIEIFLRQGNMCLIREGDKNMTPREIRTSDRGVLREVVNLVD